MGGRGCRTRRRNCMMHTIDDVATATGPIRRPLRIVGRPRACTSETWVIMEEPGETVMVHWRGKLVPHFRTLCPHCDGIEEPKPMWYVGAWFGSDFGILELTPKCFSTAGAAARNTPPVDYCDGDLFGGEVTQYAGFRGLVVEIRRISDPRTPRHLRCVHRVKVGQWPYNTRHELARIWGIPIKPRLYKEESA